MTFTVVVSDSIVVTETLVAIFANDFPVIGALKLERLTMGGIVERKVAIGALEEDPGVL